MSVLSDTPAGAFALRRLFHFPWYQITYKKLQAIVNISRRRSFGVLWRDAIPNQEICGRTGRICGRLDYKAVDRSHIEKG